MEAQLDVMEARFDRLGAHVDCMKEEGVAEAELARFVDRYTFEFVRTYPDPIERVWRAIVDDAEISVWFWTAEIDAQLGGTFHFGGEDSRMRGVIVSFDPPRLIRFSEPPATGEDGYFQFALEPAPGGTRLTFTQHGTPGFVAEEWPWPGLLSGWHLALDSLGAWMEGRDKPPADEAALEARYADHAQATRPPAGATHVSCRTRAACLQSPPDHRIADTSQCPLFGLTPMTVFHPGPPLEGSARRRSG